MAPRQRELQDRDPSVMNASSRVGPPVIPNSRLPRHLRFPVLAVTSLSLSSILFSIASEYMGGELASVARKNITTWQIAAIAGWRIIELGVGWYSDFDDIDIAALAILSHVPSLYFLYTFYDISVQTTTLSLIINVISISLPVRLLRHRSLTHDASAPSSAVPYRPVFHDFGVLAATSLLAASLYGVILYGSQKTWLPVFLATHFSSLRSFDKAHSEILPGIIAIMVPIGWAAREFLFLPAIAARGEENATRQLEKSGKRSTAKKFNPATASLSETIKWNLLGWELHQQVLLKRTAVLLLFSGLNVWYKTFLAVKGADVVGTAGWAGLWAAAAIVNASVFDWVSNV